MPPLEIRWRRENIEATRSCFRETLEQIAGGKVIVGVKAAASVALAMPFPAHDPELVLYHNVMQELAQLPSDAKTMDDVKTTDATMIAIRTLQMGDRISPNYVWRRAARTL